MLINLVFVARAEDGYLTVTPKFRQLLQRTCDAIQCSLTVWVELSHPMFPSYDTRNSRVAGEKLYVA